MLGLRFHPHLKLGVVLAVCAAAACAGGQKPRTLSTLESARRARYLIVPDIARDPGGEGLPGTGEQLRYWVAQYMAQVGLALVADPRGPYDVEVRLSVSARGGALLLHGGAAMMATAGGSVLDQWSTGDHVEPSGTFARTLARELVEAMVHSTRLAAYADARSGGRPPAGPGALPPGAVIPAVAMSPAPEGAGPALPPGSPLPAGAVVSDPAPAAPAGPPDTAAARAHTRQGSAYYDLNRFREAYQEFEQAYLIEQDPALLYNMGQCQRKLGNSEEALHFYRTYLRRAPKGPSSVEADKRVHELEDTLARERH